jgi:hypothetical protein
VIKNFPILPSAGVAVALMLLPACKSMSPQGMDANTAKGVDSGVRRMAAAIAHDLAQDGPTAWVRYFDDRPDFFMAANGQLQFSSVNEARTFLPKYAAGFKHLDLTWSEIRVDAVAPGMAVMGASYKEVFTDNADHTKEYNGYFTGLAAQTATGWKFRDAHWSAGASSK